MLNEQVVLSFIGKATDLNSTVNLVEGGLQKIERAIKAVGAAGIAIGTGIGVGLGKSTMMAAEFESGLRSVNSILQETDGGLSRLGDQILDLATRVPKSANDLAAGAYEVASAGFTTAEDTRTVLEAAAKAAAAGGTETAQAVTGITTVLNSYNLEADQAGRVSDALFKTVEAGVVNFEQLSHNVGDFIGIGRAAGATLEESLGTYAQLTIATGQYARSATAMNAIFRSLINPTDALQSVLDHLGEGTAKQMIENKGLIPTIRQLVEETGGQETALFELFGNVEAVNGVLAIMSQNERESAEFIAQFTDEAKLAGSTAQALAQRSKALNYQIELMKTTFGAIAIEVGQAFLPAVKAAASVLGVALRLFAALPDSVKQGIGVLALLSSTLALAGGGALLFRGKLALIRVAINYLIPVVRTLIATQLGQAFTSWAGSSRILSSAFTALGGSASAAAGKIAVIAAVAAAAQYAVETKTVRSFFWDQIDTNNARDNLRALAREQEATGASADAFGKDFSQLDNVIRRLDWGIIKRQSPTFQQAVDDVDELDKALVNLAKNSPEEAGRIFDKLTAKMREQGITTAQMKKAFNDYYAAIDAGNATSKEAAANTELMEEAAKRYEEQIQKAKDAQEDWNDSIEEGREMARTFLGIEGILGGIEEAHRDAWDEGADGMNKAADAAERLADAQADVEEIQEKINRILYVTNNAPIAGTETARDLGKLQRDLARKQRDVTQAVRGTKDEYKETPATIREITAAVQKQTAKFTDFNNNLQQLALRGVAPEVIQELRGMGEEGAAVAKAMAEAPPAEFEKLKGALAEKVRLEGQAYNEELQRQLTIASAIAAAGAQAGVTAILTEVDKLAPGMKAKEADVRSAAAALGVAIADGIRGGKSGFDAFQRDLEMMKQQMLAAGEQIPGWLTLSTAQVSPEERQKVLDYMAAGGAVDPNKQAAIDAYMGIKRDQGGILPPGANLVYNGTGKNEYILTPSQMVASRRDGGGSSTLRSVSNSYSFGDIYANDYQDIMRRAERARRIKALEGAHG